LFEWAASADDSGIACATFAGVLPTFRISLLCIMTSSNPPASVVPTEQSAVPSVDPDNLGFLTSLVSAPCFRETALYSIGGSTALAALHLQRNRKYMCDLRLRPVLFSPIAAGDFFSRSSLIFLGSGDVMRSAEVMVKSGCAFAIIHW
jgi:hypothetical protein